MGALIVLPGIAEVRAAARAEVAGKEAVAVARGAEGAAEAVSVAERSASTPFGRLVQSFKEGNGGWRRISAHAEQATSNAYKGGTSVEEVFERGSDQIIRHRIYGPAGKVLHETFRPYAKFGAP
jgi:hypothetical protein